MVDAVRATLEWDRNTLWLFGRWSGIAVGTVKPQQSGGWFFRVEGGAAGGTVSSEREARNALEYETKRIMRNAGL